MSIRAMELLGQTKEIY